MNASNVLNPFRPLLTFWVKLLDFCMKTLKDTNSFIKKINFTFPFKARKKIQLYYFEFVNIQRIGRMKNKEKVLVIYQKHFIKKYTQHSLPFTGFLEKINNNWFPFFTGLQSQDVDKRNILTLLPLE